jgi:hypothetical protein
LVALKSEPRPRWYAYLNRADARVKQELSPRRSTDEIDLAFNNVRPPNDRIEQPFQVWPKKHRGTASEDRRENPEFRRAAPD